MFAEQPGSDMRPYDRLIGAALDGRHAGCSPSRTRSRPPGGWSTRCSATSSPSHPYAKGSWGPKEADAPAAARRDLARPGRLSREAVDDAADRACGRTITASPGGDRGRRLRRSVRGARVPAPAGRRSPWWTAPPTTCSSRCSTSAPPGCCRRARSRCRCGAILQQARQRRLRAGRGDRLRRGRPHRAGGAADRRRAIEFPYDDLIVAAGVQQSYFGHDEFAAFAPGMKTLADALMIRRRIFGAFEMAQTATDPAERRRWLTVRPGRRRPDRRRAGRADPRAGHPRPCATSSAASIPTEAKVLLFDGGDAPLAPFGPKLSAKAAAALTDMGVELHMGSLVTDIDETGWWSADQTARVRRTRPGTCSGPPAWPRRRSPTMLAKAAGAEQDKAGRILVQPDLTLPGHPEISVVGDLMSLDRPSRRRRGGHADRVLRGQADPERGRRDTNGPEAVQVPRPRLRRLPRARSGRHLGRPGPSERPARLVGLARHPHRLPDRLPQPPRRDAHAGRSPSAGRPGANEPSRCSRSRPAAPISIATEQETSPHGRLPTHRRPRADRRPADRRAGDHGRIDRLVLLSPVRLAERLRRAARPRARRLLPGPGDRRRRHQPGSCTSRTPRS